MIRAAFVAVAMVGALSAAAADIPPAAPAADAAAPAASAEAAIPFANHGGIYNWQVIDAKTVLIQSQSHKWYKATLLSSCFDLPFAERLGFESNADGSFDKFSSIKVREQNCPLVSLVETTAPAKKSKAKNKDT
jgi:hypothetical protein